MRVKLTLWICCGAVLVLASLVHCKRGKRKRIRCDETTNTTYLVTASQLARQKGFKIGCKKNEVIAHLEVAGHRGACQGLTPDLYVQVNVCLWKRKCKLRYNKGKGKYMLKVLAGPKPECAISEADRFTVSYGCALAEVNLMDIMSEESASGVDGEVSLDRVGPPVQRGIVRSHENFPWHYTPSLGAGNRHYKLVLPKPSGASQLFAYTIRFLKVSHGDRLVVTGADGTSDEFDYSVTNSTFVTDGSGDVTFNLHTTTESTGGEGFIICFQWQNSMSASDVCQRVIRTQYCNKRKTRKHGKKKGNGRRKNRGRNQQSV